LKVGSGPLFGSWVAVTCDQCLQLLLPPDGDDAASSNDGSTAPFVPGSNTAPSSPGHHPSTACGRGGATAYCWSPPPNLLYARRCHRNFSPPPPPPTQTLNHNLDCAVATTATAPPCNTPITLGLTVVTCSRALGSKTSRIYKH
jgi:hypothetical protein